MSSISISQSRQATNLAGQPVRLRAGAFLIDTAIIIITAVAVMMFVFFHLAIVIILMGRDLEFNESADPVFNIAAMILLFGYFILFEGLYGATPGKLLFRMHVMKANGDRCDLRAAVVRALCLFVDTMLFGLPAFLSMQPPLYQRIGDRVAKTVVVSRNEGLAALPPFWRFLVAAVIYLMMTSFLSLIMLVASCRII